MLLRVLIADDEEKICQLILKLVDWESLGLTVAATVSNGVDAIREIARHKPEIIITDIRMPGIDGMELISRAKKICPDTEIIIISGYRHFEYAQMAIRFGVRNYLLKPIKKEELRDALKKLVEIYKEKNEQLSFEERVRLVLKNDAGKLRTSFISQLIYGRVERSRENSLESVNTQYHFHFRAGVFQVIGIKFDRAGHDDSSIAFLADKTADLIRQLLEPFCFDYELYVECAVIYLLINYGNEEQKNIQRGLRRILDELKMQESILRGMQVTLGLGRPGASVDRIRESFLDARFMLWQRIVEGTGRVLEMDEEKGRETSDFINSELFYQFNKEMDRALESLKAMDVRKAIYHLKEELAGYSGVTGYEILQMAKGVCNHYLLYMKRKNINIEKEQKFMELFNRAVEDCISIDEVFGFLSGTVCNSFKNAIEVKLSEDNKPIRVAKQYIQENYMKQVTLEEVSAMAGFAPGYFSTLFKKETGIPFLEFVQSARMEAAKRILTTTNDRMNEVCEQVGYSDVKYFTKCFIKYTGLKPGEYRKIYS